MQTNHLAQNALQLRAGLSVNLGGTNVTIDTKVTQPGSPFVRYELIDKEGNVVAIDPPFMSAGAAAQLAKSQWPDQEQDPERTGKGWDIQIEGAK